MRVFRPTLAALVALAASAALGFAQGSDPRFRLSLPLLLDGAYLGDLSAEIDLQEQVAVDPARLLQLVGPLLDPANLAELRTLAARADLLDPEALATVGIGLVYDPGEIALTLELAAEQRATTELALGTLRGERPEDAEPPARLAAGLGLAVGQDYRHDSDFDDDGLSDPIVVASGFVTVGGFQGVTTIFEGAYDGTDPEDTWQRRDVTVLKDDWERAIRYSAWDVRNVGIGFQEPVTLGGIGIQRLYDVLQPFANVRPGGRSRFVLENAADVDIVINGAVVQTLRLSPGSYDIRDFPITDGFNEVEIVARDAAGRRQLATLSVFTDTTLLADGVDEFELIVGAPQKPDSSNVRYEASPAVTAFYRRGVREMVTLDGNLQASDELAMAGTGVGFGTRAGLFGVDAAASVEEGGDTGLALGANWRLQRPLQLALTEQYDFGVEYRTGDFATLGQDGTRNPRRLTADARYRRSFANGLSASVGAGATLGRRNTPDERRASIGLSRLFGPVSAFVSGDVLDRDGDSTDFRLFLSFTWRLDQRHSVRGSYDTRNKRAALELNRRQRLAVDDLAGRLRIERSDDDGVDVTGELNYIGNRAELDLSHDLVIDDRNGKISGNVSRYRVRTGIGFADGAVAVGRDPTLGFAILETHPTLEDRPVRARNRSSEGDAARSSRLGPALVPLRQPYQTDTITIDVDDAPLGYDLGSGDFRLFPSARSGYRLMVGSDASNIVLGHLQNAEGEPLALATGRLELLDGAAAADEPVLWFSNRTGRFVAEGVAAGRYAIHVDGKAEPIGTIEIPETTRGLFEAGTVVVH